jgi:tripartite-type tricarboxylate transporter receptor subunit TctC
MTMYRRSAGDFVVGAVALLAAFGAQAQSCPAKPVRVVVPFAPGGGADLTARPVSQKLSEHLGQQFVVDNRGGAAGAIGMEIVAKSPPDGYTLMVMSSSFSATPATRKLPFDLFATTTPVVEIGHTPSVVVVHPSLPKLPAVAETLPGFETVVWYGVWVPRGTPQPIVEHLNATVNRILEAGDIKKWLEAQGMAASGGAPDRLEERARKDYERWVRVVKDSNIRIE